MFTPLSGEVRLAGTVPAMQFGGGWISKPGGSPGWGPASAQVYQAQVVPTPQPAVQPGPSGQPVAVPGPTPALKPAPVAPTPVPTSALAIALVAAAGIAAVVLS